MKFYITRTSLYDEEEQPCPEAVRLEKPVEIGWAYTFHWEIEFATLEALAEFCERYKRIVLASPNANGYGDAPGVWAIEIYDGYRE